MGSRTAIAFVVGILVGVCGGLLLFAPNQTAALSKSPPIASSDSIPQSPPVLQPVSQLEPKPEPTLVTQTTEVAAFENLPDDWVGEFQIGKNGRVPIITLNLFGQEIRMLVDTGCTVTGIDHRFRSLLGEKAGKATLTTAGDKIERDVYDAPEFNLAGCKFKSNEPVFCDDLGEMRLVFGEDFWGLVGMDVLRHFVVHFDFDRGTMRLSKRFPEGIEEWTEMPLEIAPDGHASLSVLCGNVRRSLLIDTGAESELNLDKEVFAHLTKVGDIEKLDESEAFTASGLVSSGTGAIKTFSLGPFSHRALECRESSLGLIGMPYLSRFRIVFDFPNGVSYFQKGDQYTKTKQRRRIGMIAIRTPRGYRLRAVHPMSNAEAAGLQAGDEIVEINGQPASDFDRFAFRELLSGDPGKRIELTYVREEQKSTAVIVLAEELANKPQGTPK